MMRRLPWRRLIAALAAVQGDFTLAGCGEAIEDSFPLSREEVQVEIDAAGESQQAFLADGVITPSERERAYLNFVQCAAEDDVRVYDFQLNPRGGDSFNTEDLSVGHVSQSPGQSDGPADGPVAVPGTRVEDVVSRCRGEHYVAVGLLHAYQNRRSGDELTRFEGDVAQCMRDRGVDVPAGATQDQMAELDRAANGECFKLHDG